jgi:hypothetical protein
MADAKLSPAAERALAKAEARRANGRKGPEPTRYGDWERNGIASDF